MRKLHLVLASLTWLLASVPLVASAEGLVLAAGYAKRDEIRGAEIQAGYRKQFNSLGLNVIPLSGIWHTNKDSHFREETFANGQTVCRDTTNGQFADKDNCSRSFSYAFIASADWTPIDAMSVGAGVRLGSKADPFLSLRLRLGSSVSLQASGGGKYVSGAVAIGY